MLKFTTDLNTHLLYTYPASIIWPPRIVLKKKKKKKKLLLSNNTTQKSRILLIFITHSDTLIYIFMSLLL